MRAVIEHLKGWYLYLILEVRPSSLSHLTHLPGWCSSIVLVECSGHYCGDLLLLIELNLLRFGGKCGTSVAPLCHEVLPIELKIELRNGTWIGLEVWHQSEGSSIDSSLFGSRFVLHSVSAFLFLCHSIFIECSLCFAMFPSSSTAVNLPGLLRMYLRSARVRQFRINCSCVVFSIHDNGELCASSVWLGACRVATHFTT